MTLAEITLVSSMSKALERLGDRLVWRLEYRLDAYRAVAPQIDALMPMTRDHFFALDEAALVAECWRRRLRVGAGFETQKEAA